MERAAQAGLAGRCQNEKERSKCADRKGSDDGLSVDVVDASGGRCVLARGAGAASPHSAWRGGKPSIYGSDCGCAFCSMNDFPRNCEVRETVWRCTWLACCACFLLLLFPSLSTSSVSAGNFQPYGGTFLYQQPLFNDNIHHKRTSSLDGGPLLRFCPVQILSRIISAYCPTSLNARFTCWSRLMIWPPEIPASRATELLTHGCAAGIEPWVSQLTACTPIICLALTFYETR